MSCAHVEERARNSGLVMAIGHVSGSSESSIYSAPPPSKRDKVRSTNEHVPYSSLHFQTVSAIVIFDMAEA